MRGKNIYRLRKVGYICSRKHTVKIATKNTLCESIVDECNSSVGYGPKDKDENLKKAI